MAENFIKGWENMSIYSIILAGDKGEGMKSKKSKYLHKISGKPMIEYIIENVKNFGFEKSFAITNSENEEVKSYFEDFADCIYKTEDTFKRLKQLNDSDGTVVILSADMPFITSEVLNEAILRHREDNNSLTTINSCVYILDLNLVDSGLSVDKIKDEFINNSEKIENIEVDNENTLKIDNRIQLAEAEKIQNRRNLNKLMLNGVTIKDPDNTYIESNVKIGMDTIIYPGCVITGETVIGEDCIIGPNSMIENTVIGSNTSVVASKLADSEVGSFVNIGPFAYLRPNSKIADNVKIGDFVEIKNSNIDSGTKVSHLTYVGDSDVGKNVNFGCGTVTVNYDGKKKHRTVIGDNAFIGCNTNLVAPVTVESGAYTAAGSTITETVPEDALAIARARQVIKVDWVKKKRE